MVNLKRRASLKDVADQAQVSVATVDRVLNDRGMVKAETVKRVKDVATQLGYQSGIYRDDLFFNILLQDPDHYYYRDLGAAIASELEGLGREGVHAQIHYLAATDDATVAAKIEELSQNADGLVGVFLQNTLTTEALSKALEQGKSVITLLTDVRHPRRTRYIGLDNRTVGRTAGYLLGRLIRRRSGKILVTSETMNYLGLEEREMGLRSVLLEKFPELKMSSVVENGGDRDAMIGRVTELVRDPDIVGVYNAGGRNSLIAEAIRLAGRHDERVVFVGSELTEVSRRLLIDGVLDAVISFPAPHAAKAVAAAMLVAAGGGPSSQLAAYQPLQIYLVENAIVGEW